ncbi:YfiM family protein [Chondromyces crocatus]|nr:hypothetical protein [Chondromyces crocatus]
MFRLLVPVAALVASALVLAPNLASAQESALPRRSPLVRPAAPALAPRDPWVGHDKALHFTASAAIAGGGYALGALGTRDVPGRLAVGAILALSAGATKEVLDAAGFGQPSLRDLAWDVVGTVFGLLFAASVDYAARPAWFAPGR